jgi:hypothetical protein
MRSREAFFHGHKKQDDGGIYLRFRLNSHHDSLMDKADEAIDDFLEEDA